jgi:hypothetical protein
MMKILNRSNSISPIRSMKLFPSYLSETNHSLLRESCSWYTTQNYQSWKDVFLPGMSLEGDLWIIRW